MLHAKREWPKVINTNLWPFALKLAICNHNHLCLNENNKTPISTVDGIEEVIEVSDFHPFGCIVFVINERNQSGVGGTPKWDPRSRAGVCLGQSPTHASNVALA